MALRQFSLTDFRNLTPTTIDFHNKLNVVTGSNAAGKTNLLEAIYIICHGQSFRSQSLDNCIQERKNSFLLFGRFNKHRVGLSRTQKETKMKVDGDYVNRLSALNVLHPIKVIHSESFRIISGQPKERRAFIDWLLFHVEPRFRERWKQYQHALKQRNALLRSKRQLDQLDYWDNYLAQSGEAIRQLRAEYCDQIADYLNDKVGYILDGLEIELNYRPGWKHKEESLMDALKKKRDLDAKRGFTSVGIHRDDIEITYQGKNIDQYFSRGQLKRSAMAMNLAQILILNQKPSSEQILLLDDLQAELDDDSAKKVISTLVDTDLQVFISNIKPLDGTIPMPQQSKMFHVEHGIIRAVK